MICILSEMEKPVNYKLEILKSIGNLLDSQTFAAIEYEINRLCDVVDIPRPTGDGKGNIDPDIWDNLKQAKLETTLPVFSPLAKLEEAKRKEGTRYG